MLNQGSYVLQELMLRNNPFYYLDFSRLSLAIQVQLVFLVLLIPVMVIVNLLLITLVEMFMIAHHSLISVPQELFIAQEVSVIIALMVDYMQVVELLDFQLPVTLLIQSAQQEPVYTLQGKPVTHNLANVLKGFTVMPSKSYVLIPFQEEVNVMALTVKLVLPVINREFANLLLNQVQLLIMEKQVHSVIFLILEEPVQNAILG